MLQFLQNLEPSMELLFLKFEAECFDDKMLQTVISWPDKDINKLLRDWRYEYHPVLHCEEGSCCHVRTIVILVVICCLQSYLVVDHCCGIVVAILFLMGLGDIHLFHMDIIKFWTFL